MVDTTRRRLLSASCAVAAGSTTALSGCVGELRDAGDGGDGSDGDASSLPSFGQWLYALAEVGLGAYAYHYVDVATVDGNSEYDLGAQSEATMIAGFLNSVDLDGIEGAVSVEYPESNSSGIAAYGSMDLSELRTEIESNVEDDDSVESESYDGYKLYHNEQSGFALAEDDSAILQASVRNESGSSGRDIVAAMIDARAGTVDRLDEADASAAALLSHQADAAVAYGTTTPTENDARIFGDGDGDATIESGGYVVNLDDGVGNRLIVVTETPVEDAESLVETLPAVDVNADPEIERDGRVVTVETGGGSSESTDPENRGEAPQAQFDFQFDADAGTVTITHQGGDTIAAENLQVLLDSGRLIDWSVRTSDEDVTAGSSITLSLADDEYGSVLFVRWTGGEREQMLAQFEIPDGSGGDSGSTEAPEVTLRAEFDYDRGRVTVIHGGGDTVPADQLDVVFETDDFRVIRWSEVSGQSDVSPGDAVTVGFSEADYGGRLLLGWRPEEEVLDDQPIPAP